MGSGYCDYLNTDKQQTNQDKNSAVSLLQTQIELQQQKQHRSDFSDLSLMIKKETMPCLETSRTDDGVREPQHVYFGLTEIAIISGTLCQKIREKTCECTSLNKSRIWKIVMEILDTLEDLEDLYIFKIQFCDELVDMIILYYNQLSELQTDTICRILYTAGVCNEDLWHREYLKNKKQAQRDETQHICLAANSQSLNSSIANNNNNVDSRQQELESLEIEENLDQADIPILSSIRSLDSSAHFIEVEFMDYQSKMFTVIFSQTQINRLKKGIELPEKSNLTDSEKLLIEKYLCLTKETPKYDRHPAESTRNSSACKQENQIVPEIHSSTLATNSSVISSCRTKENSNTSMNIKMRHKKQSDGKPVSRMQNTNVPLVESLVWRIFYSNAISNNSHKDEEVKTEEEQSYEDTNSIVEHFNGTIQKLNSLMKYIVEKVMKENSHEENHIKRMFKNAASTMNTEIVVTKDVSLKALINCILQRAIIEKARGIFLNPVVQHIHNITYFPEVQCRVPDDLDDKNNLSESLIGDIAPSIYTHQPSNARTRPNEPLTNNRSPPRYIRQPSNARTRPNEPPTNGIASPICIHQPLTARTPGDGAENNEYLDLCNYKKHFVIVGIPNEFIEACSSLENVNALMFLIHHYPKKVWPVFQTELSKFVKPADKIFWDIFKTLLYLDLENENMDVLITRANELDNTTCNEYGVNNYPILNRFMEIQMQIDDVKEEGATQISAVLDMAEKYSIEDTNQRLKDNWPNKQLCASHINVRKILAFLLTKLYDVPYNYNNRYLEKNYNNKKSFNLNGSNFNYLNNSPQAQANLLQKNIHSDSIKENGLMKNQKNIKNIGNQIINDISKDNFQKQNNLNMNALHQSSSCSTSTLSGMSSPSNNSVILNNEYTNIESTEPTTALKEQTPNAVIESSHLNSLNISKLLNSFSEQKVECILSNDSISSMHSLNSNNKQSQHCASILPKTEDRKRNKMSTSMETKDPIRPKKLASKPVNSLATEHKNKKYMTKRPKPPYKSSYLGKLALNKYQHYSKLILMFIVVSMCFLILMCIFFLLKKSI
ncbi:hypothetical protein NEOKW01_2122 [Nematocida sp. AWRm80]|nr:hypothetical protein NEOKW01_2122 [Nematocida sp. AWRm80]